MISKAKRVRGKPFIVFLGQTVSEADVLARVPTASLRPPARQGDLARLPRGTTAVIIDCPYSLRDAPSVAELKTAAKKGIRLVGGGGVGAYLASRCADVWGVGLVHSMYVNKEIKGLEPIAIALNEDEPKRTLSLVNVHASLANIERLGTIDRASAGALLEAATRLHSSVRTPDAVVAKAGFGNRPDAGRLAEMLGLLDVMRSDALTAIECAARGGERFASLADENTVFVPEWGKPITADNLLAYLQLTGEYERRIRSVVARHALSGDISDRRKRAPRIQSIFENIRTTWDWRTAQETSSALKNIGIKIDAIEKCLALESVAANIVSRKASCNDPALFTAIVLDLLLDNLALKRHCLMLSCLTWFRQRNPGRPSPSEREGARRAVARASGVLRWEDLFADNARPARSVTKLADDLALIRRELVPRLRVLHSVMWAPPLHTHRGLNARRSANRNPLYVVDLRDALRAARTIASKIGVERTSCRQSTIPSRSFVAVAYRTSRWSNVGSGKGLTRASAVTGALMEEIEKYAQESFEPQSSIESSYRALRGRAACVDPATLALPWDSYYAESLALPWMPVRDLMTGNTNYLPTAHFVFRRLPFDILFSPMLGRKMMSNNGVAAAFDADDAIAHAICEQVERHAVHLASVLIGNPGGLGDLPYRHVDPETLPVESRRLVRAVRASGRECTVADIRSDIRVPTFEVRIFDVEQGTYAVGSAAHVDAAVAVRAALLEAFQGWTGQSGEWSLQGALRAHSLGRSERPSPASRGEFFWYRQDRPSIRFEDIESTAGLRSAAVVRRILVALRDAGYMSAFVAEIGGAILRPARVVRVIVPQLGGTHPLHLAEVARALVLARYR